MTDISAAGDGRDSSGAGEVTLKRSVGYVQLTLYVLGSMLGAGIYALIGKAAGQIGTAVWMAFVVSMVAALLTGLSYASIASRHPKAGGAAFVVKHAFGSPLFSFVVGLSVACSGLASIATQSNVVADNLIKLLGIDGGMKSLLALGFILLIAGIVLKGITESMWVNALCTIVEVFGLLLIIVVGMRYWGSVSLLQFPAGQANASNAETALLVVQGAVLTFFAFIGFEDTLNVSEEVKDPERTVPLALITAMVVATVIYLAVAISAVSIVPPEELSKAPSPLALVVERGAQWFPAIGLSIITIFAVSNSALVNYVMASRLVYGMSQQNLLPDKLGRVHAQFRTPYVAIGALLVIAIALSLVGDIAELASATVLLLLIVFTSMNAALVVLKLRPDEPLGKFEIPMFVPVLGALCCAGLILVRITQGGWVAPGLAAGLIGLIIVLYAITNRRSLLGTGPN